MPAIRLTNPLNLNMVNWVLTLRTKMMELPDADRRGVRACPRSGQFGSCPSLFPLVAAFKSLILGDREYPSARLVSYRAPARSRLEDSIPSAIDAHDRVDVHETRHLFEGVTHRAE